MAVLSISILSPRNQSLVRQHDGELVEMLNKRHTKCNLPSTDNAVSNLTGVRIGCDSLKKLSGGISR